jgi:hypothetical protein
MPGLSGDMEKVVRPKRDACCKYCGLPFSPVVMLRPCLENDGKAHYYEMTAGF